jgi:hypothetical protein
MESIEGGWLGKLAPLTDDTGAAYVPLTVLSIYVSAVPVPGPRFLCPGRGHCA